MKFFLCHISRLCMKDVSELHTINKFHQHTDTSGGKGISEEIKTQSHKELLNYSTGNFLQTWQFFCQSNLFSSSFSQFI